LSGLVNKFQEHYYWAVVTCACAGQTAVHIAARRGELLVLRYLFLELSMDALQMDFDGRTALDCVPRRGAHENEEDLRRCRELINAMMIPPTS
jgi:hypothetical protein